MGRRIASESKQTVRGGPKPAKVGLHRRLRKLGRQGKYLKPPAMQANEDADGPNKQTRNYNLF